LRTFPFGQCNLFEEVLKRFECASRWISQLIDTWAITNLFWGGAFGAPSAEVNLRIYPPPGLWGKVVMSCRDTIHLICWYLEGRLSRGVEREIQQHLEHCPNCHLVLDAAMNTLDRYFGPEKTPESENASQAA
jgi:Putative zinc-finger